MYQAGGVPITKKINKLGCETNLRKKTRQTHKVEHYQFAQIEKEFIIDLPT